MKKILKWIGIGFAALLVIGIFAGKQNSGGNVISGNVASSTPKEVHRTTAQQLFADYEANEVATDEAMKGKMIEVTGTVQSIDKDFTDSIIVALRTGNEFMPARLQVSDAQKAQAMALKKGIKVALRCEKMNRIVGSPSGRDCELTH